MVLCFLLAGIRVGEASNPGPPGITWNSFDDPDDPMFENQFELLDSQLEEPTPPASVEEATESFSAFNDRDMVWNGDLGFYDHQLDDWRAAESLMKLATTHSCNDVQQVAASRSFSLPPAPPPPGSSLPADTFRGAIPGFIFGTRKEGTGYYADTAAADIAAFPFVLSLDELIPATPISENPFGVGSSALTRSRDNRSCRPRDARGTRIRPRSRRQIALRATWGGGAVPLTTALGPRWWATQGLWAIDSANSNAWSTAATRILHTDGADILLLQETKLASHRISVSSNQARQRGWSAVFNPAHPMAADKSSGGTAVCVRRGIGVSDDVGKLVPEVFKHRIQLSWVNAVLRGGIYVISVYLHDSVGVSPENLILLEELAIIIGALRGPWVAGGDWNLPPEVLLATNWVKLVKGNLQAPQLPTCNAATYDYFVVSGSLSHAIHGIQRVDGVGMHPHSPVRLLLRGDARRYMVRTLCKPKMIPSHLPHGPALPPDPSYADIVDLCAAADEISLERAVRRWYTLAREEWHGLMGPMDGGGTHLVEHAYFKWKPAVGCVASPWAGATAVSAKWRELSKRAKDVSRILTHPHLYPPDSFHHIILSHLRAATRAAAEIPRATRAEHGDSFGSWSQGFMAAIRTGTTAWSESLSRLADKKAEKLERATAKHRSAHWRSLIGATTGTTQCSARPTSFAYRWVKGLAGWTPSQVDLDSWHDGVPYEGEEADEDELVSHAGRHDCTISVPLSDQATVEKQADSWARLWKEGEDYHLPTMNCEALQPLACWSLKAAAETFPANTGLGADNFAPRALLRLSAQAVQALTVILMALEALGNWTSGIALVLIVLLPKSDGGLRPIGLFPSVIRLWMRSRVLLARAWESQWALPEIYGGSDMGSQRASWTAALMAELAALCKSDHIQVLLDLVKAFESVPHQALVEAAKAKGYSLTVLRLSLAAYRLARAIGISGVFSRIVVASRGITAGSGFATTELRILLYDIVTEVRCRWKGVLSIKMYVDDITLAASGAPKQIVRAMREALSRITEVIEGHLRMEISAKKSLALSGRPSIARHLAQSRHASRKVITWTKQAKLLGTSTSGGRRRAVKTTRVRIATLKRTVPRFRALRKAGVRTTQMARAAATPAITYGVECMGVSNTQLFASRVQVAAAASPQAAGKNPDCILAVLDGGSGTLDPAFDAHCQVIRHWAEAWWTGWVDPELLKCAMVLGRAKLAKYSSSSWHTVAGPATALLATMQRISWKFVDQVTVEDDIGRHWNFLQHAPHTIVKATQDSVRRWRALNIGKILPALIPTTPDFGAEPSMVVPVMAPIAKLLSGRYKSKQLPWNMTMAAQLTSAASGGQWPQARKAGVKKWGITDSRCQLCLQADGTLAHRHVCESTRPDQGWPLPPPPAMFGLSKLRDDRRQVSATRALLVVRVPRPIQRDESFRWLKFPDMHVLDAIWYIDGSLFEGSIRQYAVTGFAIVVVSKRGDLLGFGHGTPPSWITTAPAAEAWALQITVANAPVMPAVRTDCYTLLTTAMSGPLAAASARKPLAAIWRAIAHHLDDQLAEFVSRGCLVWMPAHQSLATFRSRMKSDGKDMTTLDWRANRLADALAKAAAVPNRIDTRLRLLMQSFDSLALHDARLLGQITQAANACQITVVDEHGVESTVTRRDATPKPKGDTQRGAKSVRTSWMDTRWGAGLERTSRKEHSADAQSTPAAGGPNADVGSSSSVPKPGDVGDSTSSAVFRYDGTSRKSEVRGDDELPGMQLFANAGKQVHRPRGSSAVAKAKASTALQTERFIQRIGESATAATGRPSAAARLEAMRARLRAKSTSLESQ